MQTVKISPKYQVVIPPEIRKSLQLSPGESLQIFSYHNRVELIPIKNIKKMRGFLKGIDTTIERDKDRV